MNYTFPKYKIRITNPRVDKNSGSSNYSYRVNGLATTELTLLDFNGDGKTDILCQDGSTLYIYETAYNHSNYTITADQLYSGNHQWDKKYPGDFNGDGNMDLLVMDDVWEVAYSTGKAFSISGISFTNYTDNTDDVKIGDYNGDGKSDILYIHNSQAEWTSYLNLYNSTGLGFNLSIFEQDFLHFTYTLYTGDYNGDGRVDEIYRLRPLPGYSEDPSKIFYFNINGYDLLLERIKNGINNGISFSYSRLAKADNYIKGTSSVYPLTDLQVPIAVVNTLSTDNGLGGLRIVNFSYEGAIIHRQGKGFLGFSKITSSNVTSGIKSVQEFSINPTYYHPYLSKHKTILASNSSLISETENTYSFIDRGSDIYWFQTIESIKKNYLTGAATKSTIDYDDDNGSYGNIESVTNVTYADLNLSQEVERTATDISSFGAYGSWIPSSPGTVTITKERTNEQPFSKTVNYIYNNQGKLIQEVAFPSLVKNVTTDYSYNSWGLVKDITVSSSGLPTKTGKYEYDLFGRFPSKITNALGQVAKSTFDSRWGKPLSVTGVDGLTTTNQYDGFGRLIKTTSPQGVVINSTYDWDIVPNENKLYSISVQHPGKPDIKTWYDILGREVESELDGMNQNKVLVEKTYDARGNLAAESSPHFEDDQPLWTTYTYEDDYNRIEEVSDGTRTTTYSYSGSGGQATISITNPAQQTVSRISDATGKLISATDDGGTLTYEYNSAGNTREVSLDNVVISTMEYHPQYGYQTELWDNNAGTTTYDYNAYGQLISQTDANSQQYTMQYDVAGRITSKTGPDGTTTYDYYASGNGLNMLKSTTAPNSFSLQYNYDQYGRLTQLSETSMGTGGTEVLTSFYTYDQYDNLLTHTYPSGFKTEQTYDSDGYLSTIKEANGEVFFSAPQNNALGQYIEYKMNNGLISASKTYDDFGFLERSKVDKGTLQLFDMGYEFDANSGNLNWRSDKLRYSLREDFTYDDLSRLHEIQLYGSGSSQAIDYSDNGNIINKFDAGEYTYNSSKRNALETIDHDPVGGGTIATQHIDYTSFDRTASVDQHDNNYHIDYFYGPDQNRMRAEEIFDGTTTTMLYASDYEKQTVVDVNNVTNTYEIHYISCGAGLIGIYVKENGAGTMYYAYTDHLGSILKVTKGDGTLIAEQSFDAWGRYRNPNDWTYDNIPARLPWLKRGFTGHEHLPEAISLINMNNRMYDPVVGRMMAVDNFVQDGTYTQGYNRYSYALNNPLKFTDPDGENPVIIAAIVGAAIFGYLGGAAANDHQFNPTKWDWGSGYTYAGIGIGMVTGGLAGAAVAVGAPALAGTGFFSNFGASGTVAAYTMVGGAAGGVAGYTTGFGTGMLVSGGDWNYSNKNGLFYGGIGFGIGTVAGATYGFINGYEPPPQGYGNIDMSLVASTDPYVNLLNDRAGDEMYLIYSDTYVYDGQTHYYSWEHSIEGGQHIRVEITNENLLGAQLDLQDQSYYHYEQKWLMRTKVWSGDGYSFVVLPYQTKTFDFYRYDYTPMNWTFGLSTRISDAANVLIRIYSNWRPGMPMDRPSYH